MAPATAAQADPDDTGPVSSTVDSFAARSAVSYWTEDRVKAAKPAVAPEHSEPAGEVAPDGPPVRINPVEPIGETAPIRAQTVTRAEDWYGPTWSPPATTSGHVYFTAADGGDYVCSGSAVNSEARNTVFTAGHCVGDGAGHWHGNWVFVPGYRDGQRPFGIWAARELVTLGPWFHHGDFRQDIGAVVIETNGNRLVDVVGGQGMAWNQPRGQHVYAFGYPFEPPFDGQRLKYCEGVTYDDFWSLWANIGLVCDMTGGSSGGPWLSSFDGTYGYLNGVNSFKYSWLPDNMYSPYFGDGAGALYNAVRYRY